MTQKSLQLFLLPVAPLKEGVLFPGLETKMIFTREASKNALRASRRANNMIFITAQKNLQADNPKPKDLYEVGTLARVGEISEEGDNMTVEITSLSRVKAVEWHSARKLLIAHAEVLDDIVDETDEKLEMMREHLLNGFLSLIKVGMVEIGEDFIAYMRSLPPGQVCDHVANMLSAKNETKQKILEALSLRERMKLTLSQLETEIQVARVETEVIKKNA